jgi:bacteriocin-like protein
MKTLTNNDLNTVSGGALPAVAVVVGSSAGRQAAQAAIAGAIGAAIEWLVSEKKS